MMQAHALLTLLALSPPPIEDTVCKADADCVLVPGDVETPCNREHWWAVNRAAGDRRTEALDALPKEAPPATKQEALARAKPAATTTGAICLGPDGAGCFRGHCAPRSRDGGALVPYDWASARADEITARCRTALYTALDLAAQLQPAPAAAALERFFVDTFGSAQGAHSEVKRLREATTYSETAKRDCVAGALQAATALRDLTQQLAQLDAAGTPRTTGDDIGAGAVDDDKLRMLAQRALAMFSDDEARRFALVRVLHDRYRARVAPVQRRVVVELDGPGHGEEEERLRALLTAEAERAGVQLEHALVATDGDRDVIRIAADGGSGGGGAVRRFECTRHAGGVAVGCGTHRAGDLADYARMYIDRELDALWSRFADH